MAIPVVDGVSTIAITATLPQSKGALSTLILGSPTPTGRTSRADAVKASSNRDSVHTATVRRRRVKRRGKVRPVALHATTIRFADRAYTAIALAADAQGISVSQYVREAALIRAVLDELDSANDALHTAHDLLAIAREVRRLAEVDPPGPPRANAGRRASAARRKPEG